MNRAFLIFAVALGLVFTAPASARATVRVFACEPEWASLAKLIGGDLVETYAATNAHQDPHHIRAKPSLLAKMRKADLVICAGASLEVGWLPILLQKAGNANTQPGSTGFLLAAEIVPVLEKPVRVDRAEGDIHPEGNPHVHLNPHNVTLVAAALGERLKAIDPANGVAYQAQYQAFSTKWAQAMAHWESAAEDLKGTRVVVHHKSFSYLLDWLGIQEAASLEAKPGIPPTTTHLESLLRTLKTHPAELIVRTPYDPADASEWLADKTGVTAVVLPFTVGGDDRSNDLYGLFDRTIELLHGVRRAQR